MKKIVIIGSGSTGLGAAYRMKELGYKNFLLYEKNKYPGGLCASFKDGKGFTWDLGGHVIFSHYTYFDKMLKNILEGNYIEHKREAWIYTLGRWIPYPFQYNIRYLPEHIMAECIKELKNIRHSCKKTNNFYEWIIKNLGDGIAKYFMLPYNFKVWAYPLNLLSTNWVDERVSKVKSEDTFNRLISGMDKTDWGPNATFKYPLYGGIGAIFRKIASFLGHKIKFNSEIISLDVKQKTLVLSNGKKDTYDILINTSPLDKFLKLIKGCNKDLLSASLELKHNSVFVVGIGFHKPSPSSKCWMYFPDADSPFFRVTYLSNYSFNNVPNYKEYYSLLCESAYSKYKKEDQSKIIEKTIQGLINSGLINKTDKKHIVSKFLFNIDYAYPIPMLKRDKALKIIQPQLEKMDIYSRGRFGSWKYEIGNTDHSFMQGKEIVDRILKKRKEDIWSL